MTTLLDAAPKPYYERDGITILTYPAVCGRLSVWTQNDYVSNAMRHNAEHQHANVARMCRSVALAPRRATSKPLNTSPNGLGMAPTTTLGRGML
jgi:hypothetical protein